MNTEERWLPVVGFEGRYEVSDHGRVRGIGARGRGIRKPYKTKSGHAQVCLYTGDNGSRRTKNVNVHSLVAAAFLGPLPKGKFCCHGDDDGMNNHLSNLRYDTPAGNSADMVRRGRSLPGQRNPQAKLTDDKAKTILRLKGTATYREIASDFDVSFATVQKIMSGEGWRHVQNK